jgi:hypothetical protein
MQMSEELPAWIENIRLDPDTYDAAREAAPGCDPYYVERKCKAWLAKTDKKPPKKTDLTFVAFCPRSGLWGGLLTSAPQT